jgi:thiamine pyrophosphate-dependent acetolactate synthase large subunit-like protein
VQVDDVPSAIGRFHPVDVGVLGDADGHAARAAGRLGDGRAVDQRPDVAARWAIWRAEKARRAADDRGRGVASAAVFAALSAHCPPTP